MQKDKINMMLTESSKYIDFFLWVPIFPIAIFNKSKVFTYSPFNLKAIFFELNWSIHSKNDTGADNNVRPTIVGYQ